MPGEVPQVCPVHAALGAISCNCGRPGVIALQRPEDFGGFHPDDIGGLNQQRGPRKRVRRDAAELEAAEVAASTQAETTGRSGTSTRGEPLRSAEGADQTDAHRRDGAGTDLDDNGVSAVGGLRDQPPRRHPAEVAVLVQAPRRRGRRTAAGAAADVVSNEQKECSESADGGLRDQPSSARARRASGGAGRGGLVRSVPPPMPRTSSTSTATRSARDSGACSARPPGCSGGSGGQDPSSEAG